MQTKPWTTVWSNRWSEKEQECWESTFSEYAEKNNLALPDEMELDRIEATCDWYDHERFGGTLGEYETDAERNT